MIQPLPLPADAPPVDIKPGTSSSRPQQRDQPGDSAHVCVPPSEGMFWLRPEARLPTSLTHTTAQYRKVRDAILEGGKGKAESGQNSMEQPTDNCAWEAVWVELRRAIAGGQTFFCE
ncbi:hypothetical protein LTR85_011283 [Meristemomyces frigidus]|nr:hypothetical protein LTR85_011283 [Meristemomyces frigidus]